MQTEKEKAVKMQQEVSGSTGSVAETTPENDPTEEKETAQEPQQQSGEAQLTPEKVKTAVAAGTAAIAAASAAAGTAIANGGANNADDGANDADDGAKGDLTPRKESPFLSVLGLAAILVTVVAFAISVWFSLIRYTPVKGLFGGEFVGIESYARLISGTQFPTALRNSVILRLAEILSGFVVSIPVLAWVRLGKKPGRILTKACMCLIPMCIPYIVTSMVILQLVPNEVLVSGESYPALFVLGTALQTGGFIAFCGGLFCYLHKRGIGGGMQQGMLAAFLVLSLSLLTPADAAGKILSNSLNRAAAETLDNYSYTASLLMANYSLGAAIDVVKAIAQLLLAVIPVHMLVKMAKKDESRVTLPDSRASGLVIGATQFIWLYIVLGLALVMFGVQQFTKDPQAAANAAARVSTDQSVISGLTNSLMTAGLSGLFGGLLACGFISLVKNAKKRVGLAFAVFALGLTFLMGRYFLARTMHVLNTPFPVVLNMVFEQRIVAVAIVLSVALRMAPERRHKGLLPGISLIIASVAWGDFLLGLIYLTNRSLYSLGLYTRMVMVGVTQTAGETVDAETLLAQQAMRPVLLVLLTVPAVLFATFGASYLIRAFKKAE